MFLEEDFEYVMKNVISDFKCKCQVKMYKKGK